MSAFRVERGGSHWESPDFARSNLREAGWAINGVVLRGFRIRRRLR